jgi:hypothetical protein
MLIGKICRSVISSAYFDQEKRVDPEKVLRYQCGEEWAILARQLLPYVLTQEVLLGALRSRALGLTA